MTAETIRFLIQVVLASIGIAVLINQYLNIKNLNERIEIKDKGYRELYEQYNIVLERNVRLEQSMRESGNSPRRIVHHTMDMDWPYPEGVEPPGLSQNDRDLLRMIREGVDPITAGTRARKTKPDSFFD